MVTANMINDLDCLYMFYLFGSLQIAGSRLIIACLIGLVGKNIFMTFVMIMGRLDGYLYFWPGMYSMTTHYHDAYDFFWSGHLCTAGLMLYEFYDLHRKNPNTHFKYWYILNIALIFYHSAMMTAVRAHYWIDLTAGLCMGILSCRVAELLAYYPDKYLFGLPKHKRDYLLFGTCPGCGWLTDKASLLVFDNEYQL